MLVLRLMREARIFAHVELVLKGDISIVCIFVECGKGMCMFEEREYCIRISR